MGPAAQRLDQQDEFFGQHWRDSLVADRTPLLVSITILPADYIRRSSPGRINGFFGRLFGFVASLAGNHITRP
jgi:hypothetical protein